MDAVSLDRVAFLVDGEPVTWGAVVAYARRTGDWQAVEATTREGLACLAADLAAGRSPARTDVRSAAAAWRTRRRLTAAEDMEAWLAGWGLDVGAFLDHLRRTLARDAHPDDASELAQRHAFEEHRGLGRQIWATAVLSGAAEQAVRTLAERMAVRARMVEEGGADVSEDLDTVWGRFREEVVTRAALDDVVQAHQLDWVRVTGDVLVFDTREAAREARLCLLDDGDTPRELAAEHGTELHHRTWFVGEVPEADRPEVLGAQGGDLLGPLERDRGWTLMAVAERTPARLDDPAINARAEQELLARAVTREVDDRVVRA